MQSSAYLIEAEREEGLARAYTFIGNVLSVPRKNPDVSELNTDTFSVQDARRAIELSLQKPMTNPHRVLIIATTHIFAEAQNALLKLFEEPPPGVLIFFIVRFRGLLLPTLRSRLASLPGEERAEEVNTSFPVEVDQFIFNPIERTRLVKKFTTSKDDAAHERNRSFIEQVLERTERVLYANENREKDRTIVPPDSVELFFEIEKLRILLHERSSPTRLILEHLALILPKNLVR